MVFILFCLWVFVIERILLQDSVQRVAALSPPQDSDAIGMQGCSDLRALAAALEPQLEHRKQPLEQVNESHPKKS